jgi:shingomyelin synthase
VLALLNAIFGIAFLIFSHSHYTIDIIIAYYITTRLFWSYHLSVKAKSNCFIKHEWWSAIFDYFESQSNRLFVNEFELPRFY